MRLILLLATAFAAIAANAQERWRLHSYDETNSMLQGHITEIVQGSNGMLWLSTWNGLCRFDGYEFVQFKPQPGDGCTMTTDRLRDVWLADNGDLYCLTDDGTYRFDVARCRFCDLASDAERQKAEQLHLAQTQRGVFKDGGLEYTDPQGLEWRVLDDVLSCYAYRERHEVPLTIEPQAMVRCVAQDNKGRIWLGTKQDGVLRLYDKNLDFIGFVGSSGTLSKSYQRFDAQPYCFAQTPDGDIWIGCKPEGLFRLREKMGGGGFDVKHIDRFADVGVYDLKADPRNKLLWVATLGAGLQCVVDYDSDTPLVCQPSGYPKNVCQRVRNICILDWQQSPTLLATTTEGLIVGRLNADPNLCQFRRHVKEPNRPTSLSCNATMNVAVDVQGQHIFVSTETGGLCQLLSDNLWADTLTFCHYDARSGQLPSDMLQSVTFMPDGRLLVMGQMQFTLLDLYHHRSESFDHRFFRQVYRFSESAPLLIGEGRWLFPTLSGAFTLATDKLHKSSYCPPLVFTKIQLQGGRLRMDVDDLDTLMLVPSERSLTIHFAALDYSDPGAIRYQFRLGSDSTHWNNLGSNHNVTLLDLKPGTYQLYLRSTNADGQPADNMRHLTIIARPTFWETPWPFVLLALFIMGIVGVATYTLLYIRRINRQRRLTLAKYLALVEQASAVVEPQPAGNGHESQHAAVQEPDTSDPFIRHILDFVEQNLDNSEADIGQMAEACAVSRSVLQRKMKSLMGVTPADFLREARMKRACQLLAQTSLTVSEVAYRCGFSDPKYFSRCFKQSTGQSPTDFKNTQG